MKLIKRAGNLLLSLYFLCLMLDPTNDVVGLKMPIFALVVVFNLVFYRPSLRFLPHLLLVYTAVGLAFVSGQMQGAQDMGECWEIVKGFIPLILLLWVHHYDFIRLSLAPAVVTSIVVVTIMVMSSIDERFEGAIYLFTTLHDHFIMMTHRQFLGVRVFAVYYRSMAALTLPLFWFVYHFYNANLRRRLRLLIPTVIIVVAFLGSGTRMTMLLPLALLGLVSYHTLRRMGRWRYALYPTLLLLGTMFVVLVVALASEKTESSNSIKYAHLGSYLKLFTAHPHYLLSGQGLGTRFFTDGFHRMTYITEWTYLELLRQYGLIFALPIYFVLLYPLWALRRSLANQYTLGIAVTYVSYLLIAGTPPLLISSTGTPVLLCADSYLRLYKKADSPEIPTFAKANGVDMDLTAS